MNIENLNNIKDNVEVGDIVKSNNSGIYYLLTKSGTDGYSFVELNNYYSCPNNFDSLEETVSYIGIKSGEVYKTRNYKLVIE